MLLLAFSSFCRNAVKMVLSYIVVKEFNSLDFCKEVRT